MGYSYNDRFKRPIIRGTLLEIMAFKSINLVTLPILFSIGTYINCRGLIDMSFPIPNRTLMEHNKQSLYFFLEFQSNFLSIGRVEQTEEWVHYSLPRTIIVKIYQYVKQKWLPLYDVKVLTVYYYIMLLYIIFVV